MQVRDGMSSVVLSVGPGHSLREAAKLMADRTVGERGLLAGGHALLRKGARDYALVKLVSR